MMNKVLVCDGSVDGIFTAIYKAYELRCGHDHIKIAEQAKDDSYMEQELFSEYITIETDFELSNKVGRTIQKKVSMEAYECVIRVALSDVIGRSDIIYRFVILGLHVGRTVLSYLTEDAVQKVTTISRNVANELHKMKGFLRFQEVSTGFLLSVISPKNDIVALLAKHFEDRLNNEDFMIYDEGRKVVSIHLKNTESITMHPNEEQILEIEKMHSDKEIYEQLWIAFFNSVNIKERKNDRCQKTMLPLHYRTHMTEFLKNQETTP